MSSFSYLAIGYLFGSAVGVCVTAYAFSIHIKQRYGSMAFHRRVMK